MKNFLQLPVKNLDGTAYQVEGTPAVVQVLGLGELSPDIISVVAVRLGTVNGIAKDGLRDDRSATIRLTPSNPAHAAVISLIAQMLLAEFPTLSNALACPYPQEMADCQMQCDYILATGGTKDACLDWLEAYTNAPVARLAAKIKVADVALFATRLTAAQDALSAAHVAKEASAASLAEAKAADPVDDEAVTMAQANNAASAEILAATVKSEAWRSALVSL